VRVRGSPDPPANECRQAGMVPAEQLGPVLTLYIGHPPDSTASRDEGRR
jgi:hypothetical protein